MTTKTVSRKLTLALAGCLLIQFSSVTFAETATSGARYNGSLIDQLNPNDPCAWWNTTSPDNCTGTGTSSGSTTTPVTSTGTGSSTNTDPWNWGGNDPTWNSGSDNGVWAGTDPNGFGGFGGAGMYNPPQMGFLEKQMYAVLSADYTAAVVQDMNGHGLWDSEAQDQVADEIIKKYAEYSAGWGALASGGIYLMDYLFLDKWRMSGAWGSALSYGAMGVGSGGAILGETYKVMQNQMAMLLELMELYGELPTNINQRSNELSAALGWSLLGTAAGTSVNRFLAIEAAALPAAGAGAGAPVGSGVGGAAGVVAAETLLGKSGMITAEVAEKTAGELAVKSGLWKGLIDRFGVANAKKFWTEHGSTFFKVGFATAFAAGFNYWDTYHMGQKYKKTFRKIAEVHEHNVIESFKNDANAKQTVWLILTKEVFKPSKDALTPEEAKLYAAIISQQIPLLHFGTHNEADSLFEQYKASAKMAAPPATPGTPEAPKMPTSDPDFGLGTTPKPVATGPNAIDKKLGILNVDLDLQQRLYLIKLVEGGMLMKGFSSAKDVETLETIAIALNLEPALNHTFKDNDIRALWKDKYKAVRDGMNGEVRKKVMAFGETPKGEEKIPEGDLRKRSGEIIMEDFFTPEQVALRAWADRVKFTGVIEQKDYAKFDNVAEVLEGVTKTSPITKLPTNITADGSPRALPHVSP